MTHKNIFITVWALAVFAFIPLVFVGSPVAFSYLDDLSEALETIKNQSFQAMPLTTEVFDRHGQKVGEFNSEKRFYLKIEEIPPHVVQSFISAEDKDFKTHIGIAPVSMLRSLIANLRGMAIRQGGSTITQQVARMWFLSREKTYERKIKEVVLALVMERYLSKNEILELYLNKIYLGNHSYGIEAAARNYFRKNISEISIGEAAMLAGLPKSPSRYAPHKNKKAASERQSFVLGRLAEDKYISDDDAKQWRKFPIAVAKGPETHFEKAPYFVSAVKEEMYSRFELENLPESGLKITTTLDADLQQAADQKLEAMLVNIRKNAVNEFNHQSKIEGSILSIDPTSGAVLAIQGGINFNKSQFNRAMHTKRQVGGMFMPVYVSLALERGYSVASLIGDDPMGGTRYGKDSGRKSLHDLFTSGSVLDGAPLYVALGSGSVKEYAEKLGFSFSRDDLSLALGFGEASSLDIAKSYAAFVNGGQPAQPYLIEKIEDAKGNVIYQAQPTQLSEDAKVMSEQTAFMVYHMMRDAVRRGHADLAAGVSELAGGVSSATEDLHNSWFVGVMPNIVTSVWVGAERGRARLGKTTESVADISELVWKEYMSASPAEYRSPEGKIPLPKGVSFTRVSTVDGKSLSLPVLTGRQPRTTSKNF
jgi:membrane carboxypeptidase/penicillin-binding protein